MTALFISWFVLMSIFIPDVTAPQSTEAVSYHVSPRNFGTEPSDQILENTEHANQNKNILKEMLTASINN